MERLWNPQNLEVNATEHCNVTCAGCSHLSPIMRKKNLDVGVLEQDLDRLSAVYHAAGVKVLGGEPLLHPDLTGLLGVVRSSGIAPRISICTNGVLLHRMSPEVWKLIEHMEVSIYPGTRLDRLDVGAVKRAAAEAGVDLEMIEYFTFRKSYSETDVLSDDLVPRVFRSCQVAHHWNCQTVHEGVFYRCPQSLFLSRRFGGSGDGVALDAPDLRDQLAGLLTRSEPLEQCKRCVGTVGISFPHYQAERKNWGEVQQGHPDDMVDHDRLAELEADITANEVGDSAPWVPETAAQ